MRGRGFAKEINEAMEQIAASVPDISRMGWQCDEPNIGSKTAALRCGYQFLKKMTNSKGENILIFVKPLHVR